MSMTACRECGKEISTKARNCPHCGAKVPHTKWWLWIPLGLVVAFFGYGLSIPEYKSRASAERRVCEEFVQRGMAQQYDCDKAYSEAMSRGAGGSSR